MEPLFNRILLKKHRNRIAKDFDQFDFLLQDVEAALLDHLQNPADQFAAILHLNCHQGKLLSNLPSSHKTKLRIQCDIAETFITQATGVGVVADEEFLPFKAESFDLILSSLGLHFINDMQGYLQQIHHILKPNGVFLASFIGGHSLTELRQSFLDTSTHANVPYSPRIIPMIDVKQAGMLLKQQGFTMVVSESHTHQIHYQEFTRLLHDLRGMAQNNILIKQSRTIPPKQFFHQVENYYKKKFCSEEGLFETSFEIITITGVKKT